MSSQADCSEQLWDAEDNESNIEAFSVANHDRVYFLQAQCGLQRFEPIGYIRQGRIWYIRLAQLAEAYIGCWRGKVEKPIFMV